MHHPTTCVARREDTARAVMRVETLGNLLKFMNDATLRAKYNKRGNYTLQTPIHLRYFYIQCACLCIWRFACTLDGLLITRSCCLSVETNVGAFSASVY